MKRLMLLLIALLICAGAEAGVRFDGAVGSTSFRYRPSLIDTTGMVGYWPMNEASGDSAYDYSSFSNTGVLGGHPDSTSLQPTWAKGIEQGCLSFDGVDDYVLVLDNSSFDINNGTASLWIKPFGGYNAGDGEEDFIVKDGAGANQGDFRLRFATGAGKLNWIIQDASSSYTIVSERTVWTETWYHISVIWGSGGMRMFIDGIQEIDTNATTIASMNNGEDLNIGANVSGGFYFNGLIDDVRIYNRGFTAAEVWDIYQGSTRFE